MAGLLLFEYGYGRKGLDSVTGSAGSASPPIPWHRYGSDVTLFASDHVTCRTGHKLRCIRVNV